MSDLPQPILGNAQEEMYSMTASFAKEFSVSAKPQDGIIYIFGPITEVMLHWLLDRQLLKIGLDRVCHESVLALLFSFEEVICLVDWHFSLGTWVLSQRASGIFYPTKRIKINNLRWLFSQKELFSLLDVFPQLNEIEFVGAELGESDANKLEASFYGRVASLSTKEVVAIFGEKAVPFSL